MSRLASLVLPVVLALQACATRSDVRNAPSDAGVSATYAASFDKAKMAARDSLAEVGFKLKEDAAWEGPRWRLVASQGLSSGTAGRVARVVIEDAGSSATVRVLVRGKVESAADNAVAEDLQKRIAGRLK